jgi:hypothetical protein
LRRRCRRACHHLEAPGCSSAPRGGAWRRASGARTATAVVVIGAPVSWPRHSAS